MLTFPSHMSEEVGNLAICKCNLSSVNAAIGFHESRVSLECLKVDESDPENTGPLSMAPKVPASRLQPGQW